MTPIIPLTKIGFFNPGRLTDEEIEQSFIARISFFQFVFKKISAEKPNSIPQHHLIIGQRGMGKTSLLIRIAAELRKPPYNNMFIALSFPEEQYNLDRLSKFWLNCLDALADALDKEGEKSHLQVLDVEIAGISKEKALDAMMVYETFKKWVDRINRRPVLLVDNLNLIFSKINKEEQHQLRAILISEDAPILIGASATAIEETLNYQAPFYDAFQINYLKKLTFQESIDVLVNLARITGNSNFENTIYLKKGRIEALYDLTGGTPRTLAILFPLIQNGFSEDIQTDLDALLDLVTPLYKARFEELAPQLQVVLDAIALHWDPTTLEQLRDITFLENQQISPQLKRLVDVGWLQKLDAYKAKGGAYELSERFFNIWYLMRRSSRRQKRELYCLTKFLESFYGNDLHEIAKLRLSYKSENTNQIALDLALADAVKDKELSELLKGKCYDAIMDLSLEDSKISKDFSVPDVVKKQKISSLLKELKSQYLDHKFETAAATGEKIIAMDENNLATWHFLGLLYGKELDEPNKSENAFKKVINLNEKSAAAWAGLGIVYAEKMNKYREAEVAFLKALDIEENEGSLWRTLGLLRTNHLNKHHEAEEDFKKAISLDKEDAFAWHWLGYLYAFNLERYEDAEQTLLKAIELNRKDASPWESLGHFYERKLKQYTKAEHVFLMAAKLDSNTQIWNTLAMLYMEKMSDFPKAEQSFKKAIQLDENDATSWFNLGILYSDYLNKFPEAEKSYLKSIELDEKNIYSWIGLGTLYYDKMENALEAEKAFIRATELDEKSTYSWIALGNLYSEIERYLDAEQAYLNVIELNQENSVASYNLGLLYSNNLNRYYDAELAFKKSISYEKEDADAWHSLGNVYHEHLQKLEEAEQAYRQAIELDPTLEYAKYDLVFLLRDELNRIKEAKELFETIPETIKNADSHSLIKAVFAYYDRNIGIAENYLKQAFAGVGGMLPNYTQEDWSRSFGVVIKLGYADSLLHVLEETGYDIILKPFYVAIQAFTKNEDELFLNSVAAEIREPAKKIMALIKSHLD